MPFEENGVLDDETPELQRVQGAGALESDGSQLFADRQHVFHPLIVKAARMPDCTRGKQAKKTL
jgi:hypothetical protein